MDYIASIVGVSPEIASGLAGAAVIAIVFGLALKYLWKFLLIGAVAVLAVGFLREHVKTVGIAEPSVAAAAAPTPSADQPASDQAPAAAAPELSSDEQQFLAQCKSEGENSPDDCVQLYAEKRYAAAQAVSAPQSDGAPPTGSEGARVKFMRTCKDHGYTPRDCDTYWDRQNAS